MLNPAHRSQQAPRSYQKCHVHYMIRLIKRLKRNGVLASRHWGCARGALLGCSAFCPPIHHFTQITKRLASVQPVLINKAPARGPKMAAPSYGAKRPSLLRTAGAHTGSCSCKGVQRTPKPAPEADGPPPTPVPPRGERKKTTSSPAPVLFPEQAS